MQARCPNCGLDVATPVTRFTDAPSPFRVLISTNGVASASDADLLSHYLHGVEADISAQDDTIQHLEAALKRAQDERNRLQDIFNSHASLRSSFRIFPPEVLTEIFQWAIDVGEPPRLRGLIGDLSRIGAVCRLWRATVLSSPSLWASFSLSCVRNEGLMPLLQTVLDRSREASLSVAWQPMYDLSEEEERGLLGRVLSTCQRWKHAQIELVEDHKDIYAQIRGRIPELERLELSGEDTTDVLGHGPSFDVFEVAPKLRTLALSYGVFPVQLTLPWTQITSLHIDRMMDQDDFGLVLSMTRNLQFLSMDPQSEGCTANWEPDKTEDIVTHLSLRHIDSWDAALLRAYNFPSLEELAVEAFGERAAPVGDDRSAEDIFRDFLHRSGSPIKKLKLGFFNNRTIDFEVMFEKAFRLTHLDIALPCPTTAVDFFRALVSTGGHDVLPELQSLKADYTLKPYVKKEVNDIPTDVIVDMIISRRHAPSTAVAEIQSVHITLPRFSMMSRMSFLSHLRTVPDLANLILAKYEKDRTFIYMVQPSS
ncbi:hypothetical protein ARMGADRAFT_1067215 [Armillaria gallica]|uniref:Uncharacterized protein n=1 Tax=Armillaria gallica TaxID=47427 RepID=A0A2H3CT57_ARMGA|nr:hypothetical protein ARMGADRAFT_1067215 [Armillaria gallica]